MSLLGTLAKVAIGVAIAKGVGGMMSKGRTSSGAGNNTASGNGGLLDGLANQPSTQNSAPNGGLGDLLGQVLGGNAGQNGNTRADAGAGGLGGLLEQLGGAGGASGGSSGGLGDLLGNLAGKPGSSGGLGDLLGGLAGGAGANAPEKRSSGGTFGELLNGSLQNGGEPEVAPSASEEAVAAVMLKAMIQATKADGELDENEKQRLMENLDGGTAEEIEFVNRELAAPMDIAGLVAQVPQGMEQQVYAMSVMGINLDQQSEAKYLDQLARTMNIEQSSVNEIHDQLGVQRLYS